MTTNSNATKRRVRKIIIRILIALAIILVLLTGIIGILTNTLVTPKRVTPIVLGLAHDYVDADVDCESIDITIFSTFPDLGIKLENGSIVNKPVTDSLAGFSAQDTLLSFKNFTISVNPVAFILQKKIIVKRLDIENASINAFVNNKGKGNWEIFSTDTVAETDTANFVLPEFNINNIRLRNVCITYDDLQQDMFFMMDSLDMKLSGNMSKDNAGLNLMMRSTGITSYYQGQSFSRSLPVRFRTELINNRGDHLLTINNGKLAIGTLELLTSGRIGRTDKPDMASVDIDFEVNASSLSDLLHMVPEHISSIPAKLTAKGKIESSGKLSGYLGNEEWPVLSLSFQLKDGVLGAVKYPKKSILEKFDIDFSTIIDLTGKTKSSVQLNNLYLKTSSSHITLKGNFDDVLNDPVIQAQGKGLLNFGHLSDRLNFIEGVKMGGLIEFDLSTKCKLNDVVNSDYGKINANGTARIENILYEDHKDGTTLYTSEADIKFGSNTQDSIRGQIRESLLSGSIKLDTINLTWQKDIIARMSNLTARFRTTAAPDTASLAPIMANVQAAGIFFTMGDSVRIRATKPNAAIRLASGKDTRQPEISARIAFDNMGGRLYTMGGRVQKADFRLKLNKKQSRGNRTFSPDRQRNDSVRNRYSRRDSTYRAYNRDSLRRVLTDPTTNISYRLESQEARTVLRNWDVSGSFGFQDMRFRTPYFPIPVQMDNSDLAFTTNTLTLTKAHMKMGDSDFSLKGDIEGIRNALLYNGKVSAKLALTADSLDFNQLIKAAVTGSEYGSKSTVEKDSISGIVLDENRELVAQTDTSGLGIFVIPRNLDIEFNSSIRNAKFGKLNLRSLRGSIILRDQTVQLPRLNIVSDVGSARMTMVYKAPDTKGAHLGMELNMRKIDVKELIGAFPMIDSLAPMLRSFEGVVDCKMTALTELDSLMNVQLPQTTASCYLNGKSMVLLDGETFSEISKMLMFKNKQRNLIDSIAIEMIMEDEKLLIFPFQVALDRYRVAVGGVQNLDMTFDYHISVLKSPIPFKLGLNVSGNPDKMKIRLAKAKYKDLFTVAREKSLENTVINIREEMDEKLRKSIYEIVGMDASRPMRRPRTSLPDSLKNTFFKMDSTLIRPEEIQGDSVPQVVQN